jgi:hypothetical protein
MDHKVQELIEEQKLFEVAYCTIKCIQWEILLNCFWYTTHRHKSKTLGWMHITLDQYWYHNEVFGKTILFKILSGFGNIMFYPMDVGFKLLSQIQRHKCDHILSNLP